MDRAKILSALRNAYDKGDMVSAKRIANYLKSNAGQLSGGEATEATEATEAPAVQEGASEYGGTIGKGGDDYHAAGGAALLRGMADIPAIPANLAQLGAMGYEYATGKEIGSSGASKFLDKLPDTRDWLASVPMIGPASQYKIDSTLGDYVSTAGEFAGASIGPSGLLGAGRQAVNKGPALSQLLKNPVSAGAVSGVGSEAAGKAFEGSDYEGAARVFGGLFSPMAATSAAKMGAKAISPYGGAISPNRANTLNTLREAGIRPTAAQSLDNRNLLAKELATKKGTENAEQALEGLTEFALKQTGSTAKRATPDALTEIDNRLGGIFERASTGASVVPDDDIILKVRGAIREYKKLTPSATALPIFKELQNAILKSAESGKPITSQQLSSWRTTLSKATTSSATGTRAAAIKMIDAIDDSLETALTNANRKGDLGELKKAREQYRNFLAVTSASSKSNNAEGLLSAAHLANAARSQGVKRYTQDRADLGRVSRAAKDALKPLPDSGTASRLGANKLANPLVTGILGAGGGSLVGVDPLSMAALAATVYGYPAIRNAAISSNAGQKYLMNQLVNSRDMPALGTLDAIRASGGGLLARIGNTESNAEEERTGSR